MRLSEALLLNQRASLPASGRKSIYLVCGFTPLHLKTFVRAECVARLRDTQVEVVEGLYGDMEGNLRRAATAKIDGAIVALEWSDLDERLGIRSAAGWTSAVLEDALEQVATKADRIQRALLLLAKAAPVVLVPPTLPLPPLAHQHPAQAGSFDIKLRHRLAGLLAALTDVPGLTIVNEAELDRLSPISTRRDTKMELHAGFPYSNTHASVVAELAVGRLFVKPPKKGLITDLDNTLWKGILGDDGVAAVSWTQESHSQAYALYQQVLASLAETGILIAVASKNERALVGEAFARQDLLLKESQVFPIEASWGAKSEAVERILKAWNVSADSVVFIDDSPLELAEVAARHPEMECLQFPGEPQATILDFLHGLRLRFGKEQIREEDHLRLQSLRAAASASDERGSEDSNFLSTLEARVTLDFDRGSDGGRALELVNKTNQFNLNARRFTESEWKAFFQQEGTVLAVVSYEDRFGPLGKIGVLGGRRAGDTLFVETWVMSCRAFSRNIEFALLRALFERTGVETIALSFKQTPRNGPLQEFMSKFFPSSLPDGELHLSKTLFLENCPELFHQVTESPHGQQLIEQTG